MARKLKPVHAGEILREEFMKPLGLSMNKLALDLAEDEQADKVARDVQPLEVAGRA